MTYIIDHQIVLANAPEGPVAPFIKAFANSVRERGYRKGSVHQRVRLAACFSQWLKQRKIRLRDITSCHVARYFRYRSQRVPLHGGDAASLRDLIDFLRREGIARVKKNSNPRLTAAEQYVRDYERYLRDMRALANATVIGYLPFIRRFLKCRFGNGNVVLSRLKPRDVVRFVKREAPLLNLKQAKRMTSALRSFLRYVRFRGDVTLDLAAAVPVVPNWSRPAIPRAIAPDQVRRLLKSIDRRTATGRRNYAIVLLLARLGLRSCEVAFLELDDIDWNAGYLRLRGKRGQRSELPLPPDVGRAIAAYLRRGRPDNSSRRVFLTAKAPICVFKRSSAVGTIVRDLLVRARVHAPTHGTHQFRHGLATEMLRKGSSLEEIGEVLRHCHPDTTRIYTKVDVDSLRKLALPWPGGAR